MFDREILARSALEVAPLLLGAVITANGVGVRLTEVEAYLGEIDPGSHAFRGPSKRNVVMYGDAGHLYTYFTYGMHVCANVVCSPPGVASAVLLRAGEVVEGLHDARARRSSAKTDSDLASGPARLVVALGITLADGGVDLESGTVRLSLPRQPAPFETGPRTGLSGPGGGAEYPWRFWIPRDATVSRYRPALPRRHPTNP